MLTNRETASTKRLLFVAPSAYPLGGVQTWLDYLLPGLAQRDWQPILGLTSGRFHDVGRYLTVHPWPDCVTITNPTGSAEGRILALITTIRRVRPHLVISVNIPDTYAAIERLRVRREPAPRVVMSNHSIESQYLGDAKNWSHVLDGMIGTNRLTCRLAEEYAGLESARVHYAPYGVECPSPPVRRTRNAGPLRIAYSGRLDQEQKRAQDIPLILDHLQALGVDYQFQVAGGGPSEASLKERLRSGIESGQVRFLGVLDPAALNEHLYDWADVLLVTSFWETGPIVIWEAMARGLPVASSRYVGSGLEGSLKDGDNCLLFPVGDTETAAMQLGRMTDPEVRVALAEHGCQLVNERYTRERSITSWDCCLRAILQQPQCEIRAKSTPIAPAGRLDHWLGTGLGESVRRILGQSYRHTEPGGEWPHVHGSDDLGHLDNSEFWLKAAQIDVNLI
ncbi:MAG TPA: glycosyltransferase family 4 protein [Candidatus Competibacter sp.]|nr:glycosyltransferase family 4 protein [Candidatus Competibacteraceae bacterium]HRW64693.1 glycosyltransferase family 4 protein [Candidatus Competibacter sp.]